jgi:hypothetical protein
MVCIGRFAKVPLQNSNPRTVERYSKRFRFCNTLYNNESPLQSLQTSLWPELANSLFISAAISLVYLGNTILAVRFYRYLPSHAIVRFFSRNTIIIFIGHMPLYDVAEPFARIFIESGWSKRAIIVFIMFVGLAVVSEILHKYIDVFLLKKKLLLKLEENNLN